TGFAGRETSPIPPQFPRTVAATFSGDLPANDIVIRLEPLSSRQPRRALRTHLRLALSPSSCPRLWLGPAGRKERSRAMSLGRSQIPPFSDLARIPYKEGH